MKPLCNLKAKYTGRAKLLKGSERKCNYHAFPLSSLMDMLFVNEQSLKDSENCQVAY